MRMTLVAVGKTRLRSLSAPALPACAMRTANVPVGGAAAGAEAPCDTSTSYYSCLRLVPLLLTIQKWTIAMNSGAPHFNFRNLDHNTRVLKDKIARAPRATGGVVS